MTEHLRTEEGRRAAFKAAKERLAEKAGRGEEPEVTRIELDPERLTTRNLGRREWQPDVYRRRFNNAWCGLCALGSCRLDHRPGRRLDAERQRRHRDRGIVLIAGAPAVLGWYLAVRCVIHGVVADESGA